MLRPRSHLPSPALSILIVIPIYIICFNHGNTHTYTHRPLLCPSPSANPLLLLKQSLSSTLMRDWLPDSSDKESHKILQNIYWKLCSWDHLLINKKNRNFQSVFIFVLLFLPNCISVITGEIVENRIWTTHWRRTQHGNLNDGSYPLAGTWTLGDASLECYFFKKSSRSKLRAMDSHHTHTPPNSCILRVIHGYCSVCCATPESCYHLVNNLLSPSTHAKAC